MQNSLARATVKALKSCNIAPILHFLHWLKIAQRIEYKRLALTYKVLTTTQPHLHNLICVQPPCSTRSSSLVTRPPTSSSLRTTDRSFRYAPPCLWNQLPSTLRQPLPSPSISDLPVPAPISPLLTLSTHHSHHQ